MVLRGEAWGDISSRVWGGVFRVVDEENTALIALGQIPRVSGVSSLFSSYSSLVFEYSKVQGGRYAALSPERLFPTVDAKFPFYNSNSSSRKVCKM